MSKQLPMAIEPFIIPHTECNFVPFRLEGQHHPMLSRFIIETNHKVFNADIALFLGISHDWCTKYIGGEQNYIKCQLPPLGVDGFLNCIWGITHEQLMMLWDKANNKRADKYKPILSELILTQVLPLFTKEVSTQLKSPELDILPAAKIAITTMSSLEIAELTGKAHKNVIVDIEKIINELGDELKIQPISYTDKMNRKQKAYNLDRESALLLTSGYDVHLRLKIIRRLDELESGVAQPKPAIPQSLPEALRLAATLAEEKEQLQIERDEAVKARQWINDKKVASAMGTAGALANKLKKLEAKINTKVSAIKYATVLAIQSRVKDLKASGLKLGNYCRKHGLEIQDIPDPRFGIVHSYPADAWKNVYSVDINQVLGA